ncbi:FAS1 domain-containing protein [Xylariaceae sp. FL0594]|nr:FAS1 domain-containing protein [Xylariaceae sp. FL0594]
MHWKKSSGIFALASSTAAQNGGGNGNGTNGTSLTDALQSQIQSLSTLTGKSLMQQNPQFIQSLNNERNITILAPNNDALASLMSNNNSNSFSNSTGSPLPLSEGYLNALLYYHVLDGTYYAPSNFTETPEFVPSRLTNQSYTNVTGGQRVECSRAGDGNVTFMSALKQNVSVVTPNVNFTGGTIHIIDGLLNIPQNVTDTLTNANLTACAGALRAANLAQNVSDARDVTIFAPSNEAFDAIGSILAGLEAQNMSNANATGNGNGSGNGTGQGVQLLRNIVGYHVVEGTVAFTPQLGNTTLRSEAGPDINVRVIDGQVYANQARVVGPNILCANGVIHVIDRVLNPNDTSATPEPSATTTAPAYSGASSGTAGIPFTSGVSTPTTTYPAATTTEGGGGHTGSHGVAAPAATGAVGIAALFGGAVVLANL